MNFYHEIRDYRPRLNKMLSDPDNRAEFKQVIDKALEEHGDEYVIAAMIHGSVGYYQPDSARVALNQYKKGFEVVYSERGSACFSGDMLWMLWSDVDQLNGMDEEKRKQKLLYVKYASKYSGEGQDSLSMLYPTTNYKFEEEE